MSAKKADGPTLIVGNYEVTMQLTQQRTIRLSGYVYANESNEAVNARLDAAQDALDRQYIRADIVTKEAQIESAMQSLVVHREHFDAVVQKKNARDRGEQVRLTTQDKEMIGKYDSDVKAVNSQIASLQAAIAKGKIRLNGAGA